MIFVTFGNVFCDLWEYDWGMVYDWVYHIRHIGIWLGEYATIRICWFAKWYNWKFFDFCQTCLGYHPGI